MRFHLVASPLVGPTTWSWVAAHLFDGGHEVDVTDWLPPGSGPMVVVGHSGAGMLIPQIVAELEPSAAKVVLVDAPMPPPSGRMPVVPPAFLEHLRSLADAGGVLPPWSEWFGPDVMTDLVPDPERRAAIEAELPRLPLSYFEASVTIPPNWAGLDGGYVLLSELYRPDADAAADRGWPVVERIGGHLDLVTKPDVVAEALLSLVA